MFDHEKLDVYRLSLAFVAWTYRLCGGLTGADRHARDQILRASQSVPLNIAEGNGKLPSPDRQRFVRIALGSALECAAALDVLRTCETIDAPRAQEGKEMLHRIVAMLTKLAARTVEVREERGEYECEYEGDGEGENE